VPGAPPAQNFANGNPAAAQKAVQDAIPLTPEMIEELGHRFNATQRAREEAVTELAAPLNRQINVGFAPGAATSIVNTVKGYPTAVSFFDSTGQPWPIQWDTNSNPAAVAGGTNCNAPNSNAGGPSVAAIGFYVCTPTKGSNVLEITPMSLSPRGGLVVSLEGAPKPVTFLLAAGGGRYDANLSVHVADRGPHARVDIMTRPDVPETGALFLTGMLQGVPPAEAVPLAVEGISPDDLRAWRLGKNVYLRTRYTLLSPEWTASEAEGGLTVYAVPQTPVVLFSINGRTVSASLKDPSS
jgi:intracellular multiplication protein IcmK